MYFDPYLIQLTALASRIRQRRRRPAAAGSAALIEGIDRFCSPGTPKRRALLSLSPSAWLRAAEQYPNVRVFNIDGLTLEAVRALNTLGFIVDIADFASPSTVPTRAYDLYLGHGGHTRSIVDRLPPSTFVLHYASGAYWDAFNRMSQERYDNFHQRKGLGRAEQFARSLAGTEAGEEYLARRADATFVCGPRTARTFTGISRRIYLLYLGAYVDKTLEQRSRDFERGRRRFIYVAGTRGNIQKGLDVLLEVFASMSSVHLYIHCEVEEEVLRAYRKELSRPNVHYTYHCARGPAKAFLHRVLRQTNFTISAPIDTGCGTAFLGSLGLGLIPVGYVDIEGTQEDSVLAESPSIDALKEVVERASHQSAEWCRNASRHTRLRYEQLHAPAMFGENFRRMLIELGLG